MTEEELKALLRRALPCVNGALVQGYKVVYAESETQGLYEADDIKQLAAAIRAALGE